MVETAGPGYATWPLAVLQGSRRALSVRRLPAGPRGVAQENGDRLGGWNQETVAVVQLFNISIVGLLNNR